jgi:tRNA G18 (ribose-2'-O)-methylase SpoU
MTAARRLWHERAVKSQSATARGYFTIGIEGASKAVNFGNLLRSAHAFGASFVFTIGANARAMDTIADALQSPLAYTALSLAKYR